MTIKCLKYPCSFGFKANIDKDFANLNLDEQNNFYLYNSNSMKNIDNKFSRINFAISINENIISDNDIKTITIINPSDKEGFYIKLYYIKNNQEYEIKSNNYKTRIGKIYEFSGKDLSIERKYVLKIESLENQFITISIKNSNYDLKESLILSEITPNIIPQFSLIKQEETIIKECYKINQEYIKNYLINNDKNDLLYASIEYLSLPMETYLKYSSFKKSIKTNNKRNSLNVILAKDYNGSYPQICFKPSKKSSENSLMLQFSHISQTLTNNFDIYYPLFSGFLYTKTLAPNSIGIYSHISDIHFIEKIFFYLRTLKNEPEMYFYFCEDYPKCV